MGKSAEEWANDCARSDHACVWAAVADEVRYLTLCLSCARAYAAEQRQEVVEQAARICDAEFRWSADGRVFTAIPGSDRVAALIRALAVEEPKDA